MSLGLGQSVAARAHLGGCSVWEEPRGYRRSVRLRCLSALRTDLARTASEKPGDPSGRMRARAIVHPTGTKSGTRRCRPFEPARTSGCWRTLRRRLLRTDGIPAFAETIGVAAHWLAVHPTQVYPLVDEDAMFRQNALNCFADPDGRCRWSSSHADREQSPARSVQPSRPGHPRGQVQPLGEGCTSRTEARSTRRSGDAARGAEEAARDDAIAE